MVRRQLGVLVGFVAVGALAAACSDSDDPAVDPGADADGGALPSSSGSVSGSSGASGGSSGVATSSGATSSGATTSSGSSGASTSSGALPDAGDDGGVIIDGPKATVSGITYAPNGTTPLAAVTVSWSLAAPPALPAGAACSTCTLPPNGTAAVSAANGAFTLTVPAGQNIYVTTQIGNFRRVRSVQVAETDTTLAQLTTTLPGRTDAAAGDTVPKVGIFPGNFDKIANSLDELGVKEVATLTQNDLANPQELSRYQIVLVPGGTDCTSGPAFTTGVQSALRGFAASGGTLYVSDYAYEYVNRAFPGFVQFAGDGSDGDACFGSYVANGRYDDPTLASWLPPAVGTLQFPLAYVQVEGTLTQQGPGRDGAPTALTPKVWATAVAQVDTSGNVTDATPRPAVLSIPYGCGQAFYSTFVADSDVEATGPDEGRALSYMLFRASDGCLAYPAPACAGACVPGTHGAGTACGYCGTANATCSDQCQLMPSSCHDEQTAVDRCLPGTARVSAEGCLPGQYRTSTCLGGADANRCTFGAPQAACAPIVLPTITAVGVGNTVSRPVTAAEQTLRDVPQVFSGCPAPLRDAQRYGAITEIKNPTAAAIHVDLTVTPRHAGQTNDRVLSVYSAAPPVTPEQTSACVDVNDDCSNVAYESCASGVTIPAGGSVWALVSSYYEGPAGAFTLAATTKP